MVDQTVASPASNSRRGSKTSIKPNSRSGSVEDNKKEKIVAPVAADLEKAGVDQETVLTQKPKKKSGFLSFLNCCSAPDNANTVELGAQAVPAKKAKVLQPKPGRLPTPVAKANTSTGEPSAQEAKKIPEDSIGGPEYSELKPAAKPKMQAPLAKEDAPAERPAERPTEKAVTQSSTLVPPQASAEQPQAPTETRDPPLPPLPPSNPQPLQEFRSTIPPAAVSVEPPQLIEPEESVAEQGSTINDRTTQQEQRDSDIAMVDAPPAAPFVEETSNATRELNQAQINLPPPPPRNGQSGSAQSSSAVIPNDKPNWLLPPLRPQLKGRKCLVLDLDETLVHSSFKVLRVPDYRKIPSTDIP